MASNPQHEPTMEEILASIRKIISEDSNEAAAEIAPAPKAAVSAPAPAPVVQQVAPPPPAPVPEPEEEADVLELTQEVREEPVAPPADEVVFQPREEAAVSSAHADEPARPSALPNEIFSDKSRKALDDSFARLDTLDVEEERPAPAAHAETLPSIDGATVEAVFARAVQQSFEPVLREWLGDNADPIVAKMTPIIREWLDRNLPPILEEVVRDEVSRAVRARRR